ncbi:MAG: hypothetical protein PHN84_14655 [Desulfuromonadaceae bacterium]|nr:hypothetical protein [Desulfuromonadaceae bacterium]MDD2854643.1 hypothetical protein [Desulfuromonadaceae bacterium]
MKNLITAVATAFVLYAPVAVSAMDHSAMNHSEHSMEDKNLSAHEETIDGVKAVFNVRTMADAMQAMGMSMPKGMKETHHISVFFVDLKSGKKIADGAVMVKVQNPDESYNTKELVAMQGHFGSDFELSKKGKYGVMCKFQLKDGKTRQAKFWYTVK